MHFVCVLIYIGPMVSLLQIRGVPEESRRVLKARAAAQGQSLNAYLLGLIDREVTSPTVAEVLERVAQRNERAAVSSVDVIARARDERTGDLARRAESAGPARDAAGERPRSA